ncbi:MAG: hypothetical protein AB1551_09020 [Actinomycetota bacterium]
MNRKRIALIAGALLIALLATGCSGDEGTDGGDQTSPVIVSPTTISSGSTTVDIGGGTLPEGFPDSFPIPDGATPVYSVSSGGYGVWFSSSQSSDELRSFFDENLPGNGWTITVKSDFTSSTGTGTVYVIEGNGFNGGVYVGEGAPGSGIFSGEYAFWVTLNQT